MFDVPPSPESRVQWLGVRGQGSGVRVQDFAPVLFPSTFDVGRSMFDVPPGPGASSLFPSTFDVGRSMFDVLPGLGVRVQLSPNQKSAINNRHSSIPFSDSLSAKASKDRSEIRNEEAGTRPPGGPAGDGLDHESSPNESKVPFATLCD